MAEQQSNTAGPVLAKETILVTDDNLVNVRLLSKLLSQHGYQVQIAANGKEAIRNAQTYRPALILLDIMMPEMDGYEACERLKANEQTRDIPIIFISALDSTQDKVKAFTAGGVDYITKPFQPDEVLARVKTHLTMRVLQAQLQAANQQLTRQLEELQSRTEELDTFAQAAAQDLKAPLTSIIGFADMLGKIYATMPPEELKQSFETIATNARKMDRILEELLVLAGLRQAKQVQMSNLDMAAITAKALKRLSGVIQENKVHIVLPSSWPVAVGHAPWVEEVLVNAISQAIARGGQPPRVELGAQVEADGQTSFWVRDNGVSPTAEAPAQPHNKLGLFVVRRIMERLGRQNWESQKSSQGNTFTFTLPSAKP